MNSRNIHRFALIFSRGLYSLFIIALLTSALPLRLDTPIWYLRLADAAVNNAPVLLVAIFLLVLTSYVIGDAFRVDDLVREAKRSVGFWLIFYSVLMPLQVVSYGWFIASNGADVQRQIKEAGKRVEIIKTAVRLSSSEEDLTRALRGVGSSPMIENQFASKLNRQQAMQAIDANFNAFKVNLESQSRKMLVDSIPGELRASIGGIIVIGTLLAIRRQF